MALVLIFFPFLLVYAAYSDVRSLRIPNAIPLAMIACYPVAAVGCGLSFETITLSLLLGAGVLGAGFALFAFGVFGGGDAKLLAAAAPWIGVPLFPLFIFALAIFGGILSLALLMFRTTPVIPFYTRFDWVMRLHEARAGVPYGVAIAAAGLIVFSETALFRSVFPY